MVLFGRLPRPKALAHPALHLGEHRDLDGALAVVRLRHGADTDIGAGLDVGDRRLHDAEHRHILGEINLHLAELGRFDRQHAAIEAFDRAGNAHVVGCCATAPSDKTQSQRRGAEARRAKSFTHRCPP